MNEGKRRGPQDILKGALEGLEHDALTGDFDEAKDLFLKSPEVFLSTKSAGFQTKFAERWVEKDPENLDQLIDRIDAFTELDQNDFIRKCYHASLGSGLDPIGMEKVIGNFNKFTRADGAYWAKELGDATDPSLWMAVKTHIDKFGLEETVKKEVLDWIEHLEKERTE